MQVVAHGAQKPASSVLWEDKNVLDLLAHYWRALLCACAFTHAITSSRASARSPGM